MHLWCVLVELREHLGRERQCLFQVAAVVLHRLVAGVPICECATQARLVELEADWKQMWVHPRHIHYIFSIKGITMPIAAFAIFGWCMANGGGLEAMSIAHDAAATVGTPLGWSIMSGINVIMGSLSPMLVNQPDLARYCEKPRDAGPLQGASVFVSSIVVFFLGLASTTSIQGVWGEAYWKIWDLLDSILDHYWNPGARAGVFFIALAFLLGVFATNFGANSIPFGADMTGLFPK